jgi:hypothetical protein
VSKPSDYLAIAYLISVYKNTQNSVALPDSYEEAHEHLTSYFERDFGEVFTRMSMDKLNEWGFVEIVSDPYAGHLIISNTKEIAQPHGLLGRVGMLGLYTAALNGGGPWLGRVFSNDDFWRNFVQESEDGGQRTSEDLEFKMEIPASDRIVRLDHNQISAVEDPIDQIIKLIEPENAIGDEVGFRELILGKLRAGKELIRAGIFSLQSLQLTLVVGLNMLVEKHKDTAIAVSAAKLLDLLLAEYGIG